MSELFANLKLEDYLKIAEIAMNVFVIAIVPVIGFFIRAWMKKAKETGKAEKVDFVRSAARTVYWVVEAVSKKTTGKLDDKLAEGIKILVDMMGAPLTDEQLAVAKSEFAALATLNKGNSLVLDPTANVPSGSK